MNSVFHTEVELFKAVEQSQALHELHCSKDWLSWDDTEVEGLFGRPDYLIGYFRVDSCGRRQVRFVAFELKLSDWKRALTQAFRYAAFAHYNYVLMDYSYVRRALHSIDRFSRANIGLLSFSKMGRLRIHHRPICRTPYSPTLSAKLREKLCTNISFQDKIEICERSLCDYSE